MTRQQRRIQAREPFGEFLPGSSLPQCPLDHAHFRIKIIDHRNQHGFGCRGIDGRTPFGLALMAEHDMLQTFESLRVKVSLECRFPDQLVTEDDVTLKQPATASPGGKGAFVFDCFPNVVQENPCQGEIGINLRIDGKEGDADAQHVHGVLKQAVTIGMVHRDCRRAPAEDFADFLEHPPNRESDFVVPDPVYAILELLPESVRILRSEFHKPVEDSRRGKILFGKNSNTV